jgi:hypothetical protein
MEMELELIQSKIFELRGFRVMLDFHLAELYQIETRVLKQSVRRNIDRFPSDFMFKIDKEESKLLISREGITICDLPRLQYRCIFDVCVYGAGSSDVIVCIA